MGNHALARQNCDGTEPSCLPRLTIFAPSADMTATANVVVSEFTPVEQEAAVSPFRQLDPTPELLAELAEASERLESAQPEEIIAWAHHRFAPHLTMATAFGPEGCVILSMLAKVAPETYVFNLDTGYQFQETLELRDQIARQYGIEVDMLQPELTVAEYEAKHGGPLYKTNS